MHARSTAEGTATTVSPNDYDVKAADLARPSGADASAGSRRAIRGGNLTRRKDSVIGRDASRRACTGVDPPTIDRHSWRILTRGRLPSKRSRRGGTLTRISPTDSADTLDASRFVEDLHE